MILGVSNLQAANGLKNLISAILSTIAVAIYALSGVLSIEAILISSLGAIFGGYLGANISYKLNPKVLRSIIVCSGLIATFYFFQS